MFSSKQPVVRALAVSVVCPFILYTSSLAQSGSDIDWDRARQLYRRDKSGEPLTKEETEYLDRAKAARRTQRPQRESGTVGDNERARPTVRGIDIPPEICPIHKMVATTEDGQEIRAFYRKPPGDGPFPTVICIHGGVRSATDQTLRNLLSRNPTYTRLLAAGYVTVAGDFRTYQDALKSRGPIRDCLAIVNAVKEQHFVDAESVVVFGGSGGGSIALELAAVTPLAAIVCGEPATLLFCGMLDQFGKRFEILADPHKHYTAECRSLTQKKIKAISCPVLILHGDQHPLKTLNGEIFLPELKAASIQVEYKVYPGNPHGFYWGNGTTNESVAQFMADVDAFLKPRLKTPARPFLP